MLIKGKPANKVRPPFSKRITVESPPDTGPATSLSKSELSPFATGEQDENDEADDTTVPAYPSGTPSPEAPTNADVAIISHLFMDFMENNPSVSTGQQEAMYLAMAAIDKTPTKHFSARFKSPGSNKSDATTLFNASSKLQGRRNQEKASHVTFQAATDTPSPFNL